MLLPLLLVLLTFELTFAADSTQFGPERSRWQGTINTECRVWNPDPKANETLTWSGACVNGRAEGTGVVVARFPENGAWKEERYEGEMKNGKQHGQGTLYYAEGGLFTGLFVEDNPYSGRREFPDGSRYEGTFLNNEFDGNGRYTYRDGSYYAGEFKRNLPNGNGALHLQGKQPISGHWTNGCLKEGNRWAVAGVSKQTCGLR